MKHFPHKHKPSHATHKPATKTGFGARRHEQSWWHFGRKKTAASPAPKKTRWYHRVRWKMWAIILLTPLVLIGLSIAFIAHMAPVLDALLDRYSENPTDAKIALHYYYSYIASSTEELPIVPGMQQNELEHLRDVRSLWRRGILGLIGVSFLLGILLWRAKKDRMLRPGLEYGSLLTVALMIISQFIPFDDLWTWFHTLTFPQGNWVFEYNDKIVQLYTAEFFEAAVLRIALLALFFAMCVYGLAMVLKRLEKRKAAKAVTASGNPQLYERKKESAAPVAKPEPVSPPPVRTVAPAQSAPSRPSYSSKPVSTEPSEPPAELLELQKTAKRHLEEK